MKIVILGSGYIGPTIAYKCICESDVTDVLLCDVNPKNLKLAHDKLSKICDTKKLSIYKLDVQNKKCLCRILGTCDVAISALEKKFCINVVDAACNVKTPLVDLSHPPEKDRNIIHKLIRKSDIIIVFGCGVEPGLTEVMASYGAKFFDCVNELHIKCGGIPKYPKPPLEHKILFKSYELPIKEENASFVVNGELQTIPKFSDIEPVYFPPLGLLEAYHDWFMPWLLKMESFRNLKFGTQKSLRWPGYIDKAKLLRDIGLLSHKSIDVNGQKVVPNDVLSTLLLPKLQIEVGEKDITVFRIELIGKIRNEFSKCTIEMIDHFDRETNFSSMARTTGFPSAFVALMIGRRKISHQGLYTPEMLIQGYIFDELMKDLCSHGIIFQITHNTLD